MGKYNCRLTLRDKYAQKINKSPGTLINNANLIPLANKNVDPYLFLSQHVSNRMSKALRNNFIQELLKVYN